MWLLRKNDPPSTLGQQRLLPFFERRQRLDRTFKRAIMFITMLSCLGLLLGTGVGRYSAQRILFAARSKAGEWAGLPPDHALVEADWNRQRERGIAATRERYRRIYAEASPALRQLLNFGGLEPDKGVLASGNYDRIFLLPSKVFVRDDRGRSYRMRPNVRSIWLKKIAMPGNIDGFFLMPDTPELIPLAQKTHAYIVPGSSQTTNSWGCRGPEPDPSAPLRGLILGDSNMQGLFVGDDETPPERLRHELERQFSTRVSLLNTGHLGYSPEQFFHTLVEYGDRFRPHFVLFSFCSNDFGDVFGPIANPRDMDEASYWIDRIRSYCSARNLLLIATPVPYEQQVTATRLEGSYPGRINNILHLSSLIYDNPVEDFVDTHLRLMIERVKQGGGSTMSPLFNGPLDDGHMSAQGTEVWGKALGKRIGLLLERARMRGALRF